jgi:hypothetical protein
LFFFFFVCFSFSFFFFYFFFCSEHTHNSSTFTQKPTGSIDDHHHKHNNDDSDNEDGVVDVDSNTMEAPLIRKRHKKHHHTHEAVDTFTHSYISGDHRECSFYDKKREGVSIFFVIIHFNICYYFYYYYYYCFLFIVFFIIIVVITISPLVNFSPIANFIVSLCDLLLCLIFTVRSFFHFVFAHSYVNWPSFKTYDLWGHNIIILLIAVFVGIILLRLMLRVSLVLLMGLPKSICVDHLRRKLLSAPGVLNIHELHCFTLREGAAMATFHVVIQKDFSDVLDGQSVNNNNNNNNNIEGNSPSYNYQLLFSENVEYFGNILDRHGIQCFTIQPEFVDIVMANMHEIKRAKEEEEDKAQPSPSSPPSSFDNKAELQQSIGTSINPSKTHCFSMCAPDCKNPRCCTVPAKNTYTLYDYVVEQGDGNEEAGDNNKLIGEEEEELGLYG